MLIRSGILSILNVVCRSLRRYNIKTSIKTLMIINFRFQMDPPCFMYCLLLFTPKLVCLMTVLCSQFQTSTEREKKVPKIFVAIKAGVEVVVDGCKSDFILFWEWPVWSSVFMGLWSWLRAPRVGDLDVIEKTFDLQIGLITNVVNLHTCGTTTDR